MQFNRDIYNCLKKADRKETEDFFNKVYDEGYKNGQKDSLSDYEEKRRKERLSSAISSVFGG